MGGREEGYGLMWDPKAKRDDGTWDLDLVAKTAYYITPDGTKITNKIRLNVVEKGRWVATNPEAPSHVRSYHLNAFYLPFKSGDFGHIAVAFLKAKMKGTQYLRVFIYEYLGERWKEDVETAQDDVLYDRCLDYKKGSLLTKCQQLIANDTSATYEGIYVKKHSEVLLTTDVQKGHLWALAREWIAGGDSGLIDYRYVVEWEELEEMANKLKVTRVGVDYSYEKRRGEVFEYAMKYKAWPLMGRDGIILPWKHLHLDPLEGKQGQGKTKISVYQFNTNIFGSNMIDLMKGISAKNWYLYRGIEQQYIRQAASMERVQGVWQTKKGHGQNHLWDCEVMQVVMATIKQLYKHEWMEVS